jgi:hypothetical protein
MDFLWCFCVDFFAIMLFLVKNQEFELKNQIFEKIGVKCEKIGVNFEVKYQILKDKNKF